MIFATQETSPYDIAVVSLEEDLEGIPMPMPTEHFHEGKREGPSVLRWTLGRKVSVRHSNPADQGASLPDQLPSPSLPD